MQFELMFCTILVMALVTFATRLAPFYFMEGFKDNAILEYMGKELPPCVMLILTWYCLVEVDYLAYPYGLAEIVSVIATALVHLQWRNIFLSMSIGVIVFAVCNNYFVG